MTTQTLKPSEIFKRLKLLSASFGRPCTDLTQQSLNSDPKYLKRIMEFEN
jgi:hypothetical protein